MGTSIITVLIGPPASGKSKFTKKMLKYSNWFRVNQDDVRKLTKGTYKNYWKHVSSKSEQIVSTTNDWLIESLIHQGFHVIVDNTHCNIKTISKLIEQFKDRVLFEFVVFQVPLWKLKLRNILRYIKTFGDIWIPPKVIENMNNNLIKVLVYLEEKGYNYKIAEQ